MDNKNPLKHFKGGGQQAMWTRAPVGVSRQRKVLTDVEEAPSEAPEWVRLVHGSEVLVTGTADGRCRHPGLSGTSGSAKKRLVL